MFANRRSIVFLVLIMLILLVTAPVYAAGALGLGLTVVDENGDPVTQVETGQIIEYIIDFSCGDLTLGCGDLQIDFTIDTTLVTFEDVITSPGYQGTYLGAGNPVRIVNVAPNVTFDGGESAQARIRVRVREDLDGSEVIPGIVVGTLFQDGTTTATETQNATNPNLDVLPPTEEWSIIKTQTAPSGVAPAPGGTATFQVRFCPDDPTGNISIINPRIVDTFPVGAVVVDPGGGVEAGNTLTWNLTPNPLPPSAGCQSVTYTLRYPAASFPVGVPIDNQADGFGDNPELGGNGICDDGCANSEVDQDTAPPTVDMVTSLTKTGPGINTIVAPGNSSGTSTFGISLDLSGANTPTTNVILTDILPVATDGDPATSVTVINSGTWTDNTIQAVVEITTTLDGTWQPLGTVNGTAQSWSSVGGQFVGPGNAGAPNTTTDLVTGIRWRFLNPLPPGFVFNNGNAIRFIIREGMPAADYDDGSGFNTFDNCVDGTADFTDQNGAPQTTTSVDNACAPVVTSDDTDGFANVTTNKSSNVNQIDPLDFIQFTLTVNLTEEASGNLINPAIEDILPPGLNFVSWDGVTIDSTAGDIANNPYLVVEDDVLIGGEVRDRLLFYWDDTDVLAGSVAFGGGATPPGGNQLSLVPPETGSKTITITFTAQALLSAAAGPYSNGMDIAAESPNLLCQDGGADTDDDDIDNDGATATDVLCGTDATYQVREAAEMGSQKWVRSVDGVNSTFEFYNFQNVDTPATATCPTYSFDTTGDGTDEVFTRFPCVAEGLPTENFEYLMRMYNTGLVDTDNYIMYDILPFIGDMGVSQLVAEGPNPNRLTEFEVFLTGPIEIEALPTSPAPSGLAFTPPTFDIEYNLTTNPCRPQMANGPEGAWVAGCNDVWYTDVTLPGGDWAAVRSFRIVQNNNGTGIIPPQTEMIFSAPMQIAAYGDAAPLAETGEIAWNSFAQRFSNALSGTRLLAAEPPKVGIVVAQRYSVGNRVWIDDGAGGGVPNNGQIDGGEVGLNGVTVELWQNTGSGFVLFRTDETRTDADTGADGYYFFGDLPGGSNIQYQVRIPAAEFQPGGDLHTYISSTGRQNANNNNNTDNRDTGVDPANTDLYNTAGISTDTFTLTANDEAEGEADINDDDVTAPLFGTGNTNEGPLGRGEDFEDDPDSDLTVDLGFFKPHSIGNRVWLDNGAGGGVLNNGIIDGAEAGIDGVTVALYQDTNGDGVVEPEGADGGPVATTVTANGGYYLFDLLVPDQYMVHIVPANFTFGATAADDGPLADYITSTPTEITDNETDNDDNGINPATEGDQRTDGVFSPTIDLEWDGEIDTEADKDATLTEQDGRRTDLDSSELTVDFGFFEETTFFSLGNRVWDDINNNGEIDAGEAGIDGVELALYLDDNGDGIPDDLDGNLVAGNVADRIVSTTTNPQRTLTTANGGYYLFDNLNPGRYLVYMVAENWTTGPLGEFISSTGDTATENTDSNDNGQDPALVTDYPTTGVISRTIQLVPQGEPIGELDPDATLGDPSGNAEDNNSDLTVDFGVYRPLSLGNRVWLDNGADGAGGTIAANRNNGVIDANEVGIAGVTVNLYADPDGDGVPDGGILDTDTTDAGGYYLFDNLTPGNYVVEIPFVGNFDAGSILQYHESSIPADPADENGAVGTEEEDDATDHGEYAADTQVVAPGVYSDTIALVHDSEALNDNDISADATDGPARRGNFNEADDNSDLTVDFGFYVPPLSIGNRVWFDNNDNGILDGTDDNPDVAGANPGIENVLVNLYGDFNGDGVEDLAPITTTTDADGYYLFDNLAPGDYRVELAASNFASGPLQGLVSSTGNGVGNDNDDTNIDENGIDPLDVSGNGSFVDEYTGNGVTSDIITLLPRTEPVGGTEVDRNTTGTYGPDNNGTTGEDDNGSNLTVDFGVYRPLSLGNRVWQDVDNNGVQDAGEPGIDGVLVQLFIDADADGVPDTPATPYRETVTVTDSVSGQAGYYLFDNLPEGNYVIEIAETNFQNNPNDGNPANGVEAILFDTTTNGPFFSSEPLTPPAGYLLDDGSDLNDNGIDDPNPAANGIRSATIALTYNTEPDPVTNAPDDTDLNGDVGEGRYGELDQNADMTIDFGFYIPAMSLGNRVFFDYNNDREFQPDGTDGIPGNADDEQPVAGVTVNLFQTDAAGVVIDQDGDGGSYLDAGDIIATDITNADGYYLFDNLEPGFYVVVINENNFRTGGVLIDYMSSQDTAGIPTDDGDDQFENGIDNMTPDAGGVRSPVTELVPGAETATETDKDPIEGDGEPNIEVTNSDLTVDFGFYRPMSIGNRVWFDTDDSGTINGAEGGIAGVAVSLYPDANGDGVPDGPAIDTDVTDADGFYLFDNLLPGGYVVGIDNANFGAGQPLEGLTSSTLEPPVAPEDPTDSNDNGFNTPDGTYGIISNSVQLVRDSEPVGETNVSGDIGDGPNRIGNNGEIDSNSDITIDFGFTGVQMSLGNRVWYDPNDNGIIDPTEIGLENVLLNLFRDSNADGIPDGAPIATTLTDPNGYYLFDNLAPGTYIVGLDPSNFNGGVLTTTISSMGNGGDNQQDTNVDENGIDPATLADYTTTGVLSASIVLAIDDEPLNEFDPGNGSGSATDINSDLTIDFGVFIPQSLGNRVWFDTNGNGIIDGTETGVPGVTVTLLRDNDGDSTPETPVGTDVTDGTGHYLFDGLPVGTYTVVVDATNFDPGGALEGLTSSVDTPATPVDGDPDRNDHGIDPITAGDAVSSPPIVLAPGTEPTGETDLSSDPADGTNRRGNNGETDQSSDLTVDFGFTGSLMSIGNRVWLDDGAGVPANRNNGQREAGELGIGNVLVNLYADANADGVPDGAPIATTITSNDNPATGLVDEGGYYLFDGLAPGNYIVGLDAGNFNGAGVLVGLTSSTGNGGDNQTDSEVPGDENGIDNNAPVFNGILSTTINLATGAEPAGETDTGATGSGSATDDNSDITVDFGLYPSMSIGNRVWFDPNDNGIIDAGEVGIANVNVSLYADANNDGAPDGAAVDTDVTDAGGYYLFDGLEPGRYLVVVDAANFTAGNTLEGFTSSTGSTGDTSVDSNDNGLDVAIAEGITSNTILLALNTEITGEADLSGDTSDGPNFRGNNSETNANSDLTIDFGFNAQTMSLGNRVWLDDGAGGGTPNDGLLNGGEVGIDGVTVELYVDTNGDGTPDGVAVGTTVTTGGGYYLFDNLPPGDYIVSVVESNFNTGGVLYGLVSSTGDTDDDTDSNDNGVDNNNPGNGGVNSDTVTLTPTTEPVGETDTGTAGSGNATDENSNITVDFGFVTRYDRGDAPDSYGTTIGTNGPAHQIVSNLYLGNQVDDDDDGAPTVGADGDDTADGNDDEDGIDIPVLVAGTTIAIESTVFNNTGSPANVVLWIDFNGNGTFDPGEASTVVVPSSPVSQVVPITVNVPIDADTTTGGDTYARIRVTTDAIDGTTPTGIASNGEVEDYVVTINPPGLVITKTDGQNAIVVGQATTYTITINNSGTDRLDVPFVDNIPIGDPNGFDPATISWTCTATNGANCVANSNPPVLNRSGTNANINELIDIPRNGQIVYTITATLRLTANAGTLLNTATVGTTSDDDDNGIIFDPPSGVKTGTVIGGNRIRWTMVWLNTGGAQNATITDTLPATQTFDGNLVCRVFGTSTTTSCTQANGTITWTGNIGTGQPNRVEIAFDVIVPGDGNYTNTASIDVGGDQASASDTVSIGEDPEDEDTPDDESGLPPVLLDPAIVKLVNPAFAQPGEAVTWTIIVSNPHDQPLTNVGFTDAMPGELVVLGASSTDGSVTVSGNTVSFFIDTLAPNSEVTVTIQTQLRDDVETPFIVLNTATLDSPYSGAASAQVVSAAELPATGETPLWRVYGAWLIVVLLIAGGGLLRYRRVIWRG